MDSGNPRNGQEGVQCDCCSGWFHDMCQGIEIPAIRALDRFKMVSWLCAECKISIKRKDDMKRMTELESKVEKLELAVCKHMQLVENCLKEQERTTVSQSQQIEQKVRK